MSTGSSGSAALARRERQLPLREEHDNSGRTRQGQFPSVTEGFQSSRPELMRKPHFALLDVAIWLLLFAFLPGIGFLSDEAERPLVHLAAVPLSLDVLLLFFLVLVPLTYFRASHVSPCVVAVGKKCCCRRSRTQSASRPWLDADSQRELALSRFFVQSGSHSPALDEDDRKLPISVRRLPINDTVSLYIVGTMHISSASARDAWQTCVRKRPRCVMIELDQQRLRELRKEERRFVAPFVFSGRGPGAAEAGSPSKATSSGLGTAATEMNGTISSSTSALNITSSTDEIAVGLGGSSSLIEKNGEPGGHTKSTSDRDDANVDHASTALEDAANDAHDHLALSDGASVCSLSSSVDLNEANRSGSSHTTGEDECSGDGALAISRTQLESMRAYSDHDGLLHMDDNVSTPSSSSTAPEAPYSTRLRSTGAGSYIKIIPECERVPVPSDYVKGTATPSSSSSFTLSKTGSGSRGFQRASGSFHSPPRRSFRRNYQYIPASATAVGTAAHLSGGPAFAVEASTSPPLDLLTFQSRGQDRVTSPGVHSAWNAYLPALQTSSIYPLIRDVDFPEGSLASRLNCANCALVLRRSRSVSFLQQAHIAERLGAKILLITDFPECTGDAGTETAGLMHAGGCLARLAAYRRFRTFRMPKVPSFLFQNRPDEEALFAGLTDGRFATVRLGKAYAAERLPRALGIQRVCCRNCVLVSSGVGILYGVMQCAGVQAGAEFLAADEYTRMCNLQPTCVDVSDHSLGKAFLYHGKPTFRNLGYNFLMWLSLPRFVWRNFVYSDPRRPDVIGIALRALVFLPTRTCCALLVATTSASVVLFLVLFCPILLIVAVIHWISRLFRRSLVLLCAGAARPSQYILHDAVSSSTTSLPPSVSSTSSSTTVWPEQVADANRVDSGTARPKMGYIPDVVSATSSTSSTSSLSGLSSAVRKSLPVASGPSSSSTRETSVLGGFSEDVESNNAFKQALQSGTSTTSYSSPGPFALRRLISDVVLSSTTLCPAPPVHHPSTSNSIIVHRTSSTPASTSNIPNHHDHDAEVTRPRLRRDEDGGNEPDDASSFSSSDVLGELLLLLLLANLLPSVHRALLMDRDEAMFLEVRKHLGVTTPNNGEERPKAKGNSVLIVGAAHMAGIMERIRLRGIEVDT
ncbi:unnamed protein product [Amoebophrya sp. A25]|nr:unnamed protein product [Amoebophrya sp. A25]|eukprot:GSA25T00018953001.1